MGVTTDAYLLYGINIGNELDYICRKLGVEPGEEDDEETALGEWLPRSLEVVLTGHIEGCPAYYIAAKRYKVAHRGSPVWIDDGKIDVSPTARRHLKKLSNTLNIQVGYWLASYTDF